MSRSIRWNIAALGDNRLVMRVFNRRRMRSSSVPKRIVDPNGQSHPIRGQTIVPGSFIKLIIPPIGRGV